MEKYSNLKDKKVLILGFSVTGIAAAKYLAKNGANVYLSEFSPIKETDKEQIEKLEQLGIKLEFNGHSDEFIENSQFCILSPSIPIESEILKKLDEKNIEYFSDIEFISKFNKDKMVVITGTNGKTTTTALVSHVLSSTMNAPACGNIGVSPVEYLDENVDKFVIEASSYQLHYSTFAPQIGVFCNLTPDHLAFHKNLENYFEAKAKMFKKMDKNSHAILNYDDEKLRKLGEKLKTNVHWFSMADRNKKNSAYFESNKIYYNDEEIIDMKDMQIVGPHNVQNIMATIITAKILGLDNKTINKQLKSFKAIAHRLEFVRSIEETDYYNDSKATNPEASIVAINSFKNKKVVLIAGGRDKNTPLRDMIQAIQEKISKVILIGEATKRFRDELSSSGYLNIVNSKTLEEAIDIASLDKPDIVLFSPACASFDMFENYEKRGESFKNYVLSKK